jgi:WD repeat and SOF domain-containing protein 1
VHDLKTQTHSLKLRGAHKGKTSGLCFAGENGERLLSCGVDRNVKLWDATTEQDPEAEVGPVETQVYYVLIPHSSPRHR